MPISSLFFVLFFLTFASSAFAETYNVGVSLPLSGKYEKQGKGMLNAIKLYFDNLNKELPKDVEIQLIVKDDKGDVATARKIAQDFVKNDKLIAVIGNFSSKTALATADIYGKAGVVNITPYGSNPGITESSKTVFSINCSDEI